MLKSYDEMRRKIEEGSYFLKRIKTVSMYASDNDPEMREARELILERRGNNGRGKDRG